MATKERLPVKYGIGVINNGRLMTKKQARKHASSIMPRDLKRAGFVASIFRSDSEIHGGNWFRINFTKTF